MGTFSKTLDVDKPLSTELANTTDDYIRDDKAAFAERLALEHYFTVPSASGDDSAPTVAGRHRPGSVAAVALESTAPTTGLVGGGMYYNTDTKRLHIYNPNLSGDKWATSVESPAQTVTPLVRYVGTIASLRSDSYMNLTSVSADGVTAGATSITIVTSGIYILALHLRVLFNAAAASGLRTINVGNYIGSFGFYPLASASQNLHYGSSKWIAGYATGSSLYYLSAGNVIQPAYNTTNTVTPTLISDGPNNFRAYLVRAI